MMPAGKGSDAWQEDQSARVQARFHWQGHVFNLQIVRLSCRILICAVPSLGIDEAQHFAKMRAMRLETEAW